MSIFLMSYMYNISNLNQSESTIHLKSYTITKVLLVLAKTMRKHKNKSYVWQMPFAIVYPNLGGHIDSMHHLGTIGHSKVVWPSAQPCLTKRPYYIIMQTVWAQKTVLVVPKTSYNLYLLLKMMECQLSQHSDEGSSYTSYLLSSHLWKLSESFSTS